MNIPRTKGTWAEGQVAAYLCDHGWPYAERRALAGITDKGDITGTPGIAWEVKYANGGIHMGPWIAELRAERVNARADHGVLVIKAKGQGAANVNRWLAVMVNWDYEELVAKSNLLMFCTDVSEYQSAALLGDLKKVHGTNSGAVLLRRPPGTKDKPEEWYRVTFLETVVHLLRSAGYGTPAQPTEEAHEQAHDISMVG